MSISEMDGANPEAADAVAAEPARVSSPPAHQVRPAIRPPAVSGEALTRLPQRIPGGFRSVKDDLDRRARDWKNMVRLLEQLRPQLEIAESERDKLYSKLGRVVAQAEESGKVLRSALESTKAGEAPGDISNLFAKNLAGLEELENVAENLTSNVLWVRATWEQYAQTVLEAQKLRDELQRG
ncbi:hypothetical protein [Mangrovibrevibacter kandeliae]|uniref:hypothetical protein n=1 Tax=Mangrovibrevibacter kandeliae TaxID=2968473 RepID=UPI0021186828|nr:hypothetical protein [Aurantimonas sp. CSK15Z-1]MCQ8781628.1 hypothetical protein [Aurantimonas sp. CSK15Z-1]